MESNNYPSRKQIIELINKECIVRAPTGSKELPALGGTGYYTWQFYLRAALLNPLCLQLICDDFWDKNLAFFNETRFQLAGVESASLPLLTALVIDGAKRGVNINAFSIRKNRKEYGKRNLTEGKPTDEPVLFIDDLTSPKHNAFWHAFYGIGLEGLTMCGRGYVLVLKKHSHESRIIQTSAGDIYIDSLFTLSDFILSFEEWAALNKTSI